MALAYYNEIEPAAAHVLRALIADGVIAPGDVDERSIKDVQPEDLRGYAQCHFFAGGGLWSVAARLVGWSDDRALWTGSCPCQPFSVAGKGAGANDPRHLWPDFFRLIRACRPPVVMGEQVAGAAGYGWFDGVAADLEREDYASRAVDIPAAAVDAPHIRQRLYWVAVGDADAVRELQPQGAIGHQRGRAGDASCGDMGNANLKRLEGRFADAERASQQSFGASGVASDLADANGRKQRAQRRNDGEVCGLPAQERQRQNRSAVSGRGCKDSSFWADAEWLTRADGKARRVKPGVRLLAHGVSGRVASLRLAGNAIVPQVAAEVIGALMDVL